MHHVRLPAGTIVEYGNHDVVAKQGQLSLAQCKKNAGNSEDGKGVFWSTDANEELPILLYKDGLGASPPTTVIEAFKASAQKFRDQPALLWEANHTITSGAQSGPLSWMFYTWEGYYDEVVKFAKVLLSLNAPPRSTVVVCGTNAPQWLIAYFGTIFANCISASIYPTSNVDTVEHILKQCDPVVVVVDTQENFHKVQAARRKEGQCTNLKVVVLYGDSGVGEDEDGEQQKQLEAERWEDFMKFGLTQPDSAVEGRFNQQTPGMVCTVIYTSGTTGPPKGAMLTHDNLVYAAYSLLQWIEIGELEPIAVSYLPLSHVAAQLIDAHMCMLAGAQLYFARPDALKGSLLRTLLDVRPTCFLAVPRVWEKMEEEIRRKLQASPTVTRSLANWAMKVGHQATKTQIYHGKDVWTLTASAGLAKKLVLNKIRRLIGLDRAVMCVSGAAPLARTTAEFFLSLNIPISDVYGMTESSGPITCNLPVPNCIREGSVGRVLPGTEVMISRPNAKKQGEICFRGRHMFKGYLLNEAETRATFDSYGFLHTGDIGYFDDDGFLYITGRIKELIITAGGENIPPIPIEEKMKAEMEGLVANCVLIGDRRKYLSLLVTLKAVDDADGAPTDTLAPDAVSLLKSAGIDVQSVAVARNHPGVRKLVNQAIGRANTHAFSRAQRVQNFEILPSDFSVKGGELTATLKLRRSFIAAKHQQLIDDMYQRELGSTPIKQGLAKDSRL